MGSPSAPSRKPPTVKIVGGKAGKGDLQQKGNEQEGIRDENAEVWEPGRGKKGGCQRKKRGAARWMGGTELENISSWIQRCHRLIQRKSKSSP